jgi:hypothetical protein
VLFAEAMASTKQDILTAAAQLREAARDMAFIAAIRNCRAAAQADPCVTVGLVVAVLDAIHPGVASVIADGLSDC